MEYTEQQPESNPQTILHETGEQSAHVVKFSEWLVTLIIMLIPLLNLIMLILWTTEQNTNPNKSNWAKATLVLIGIQTVLMLFFIGAFIGSISGLMSQLGTAGMW